MKLDWPPRRLAAALVAAGLALAVGLAIPGVRAEDEDPADTAAAAKAEKAARALGKRIYEDKALGTNRRSCQTCHENPKRPDLSLAGVNERFPKWDKNADRVITLQEKFMQMHERSLKARDPFPVGDERWTALELHLRTLK